MTTPTAALKQLCTAPKKTYIAPKEPYIAAQEPYIPHTSDRWKGGP